MNKNGFTLIELLAVIAILGVILLITIPSVTGIIKESRKNAAKDSAILYLRKVESTVIESHLTENEIVDGEYNIMSNGNICLGEINKVICTGTEITIDLKNTDVTAGKIKIENGSVTLLGPLTVSGKSVDISF